MKTLKLLLLMIVSVGIVSCSKKGTLNDPAAQPIEHVTAQENTSPDNPLNPYDFVGKEHNRLLAMVKQYIESGGDNSVRGRNLFLMKHTSTHTNVEDLNKAVYHVIADTASRYPGNLSKLPISSDVKTAVAQIYREVKTIKDGDFSALKSQMVKMEEGFLKSQNLSKSERQLLLSAASVARYSAYYWLNDEELNASDNGPTASRNFFWKLIRAVGAATTDISSLVETRKRAFLY